MDSATAFAILVILSGLSHGTNNIPVEHACVYDYRLISDQECRTYRAKVLQAKSDHERLVLLTDLQRTIAARAQARGIATGDWRGLQVSPLRTSMSK